MKWRLVRPWPGAAPHLEWRGRYQPENYAYGDFTVIVEALNRREFYTRIELEGVHPSLGEDGWNPNARKTVLNALDGATARLHTTLQNIGKVRVPSKQMVERLAKAIQRYNAESRRKRCDRQRSRRSRR